MMAATLETTERHGMSANNASIRGATRKRSGLIPIASMASTSSDTSIVPSSAEKAAPILANAGDHDDRVGLDLAAGFQSPVLLGHVEGEVAPVPSGAKAKSLFCSRRPVGGVGRNVEVGVRSRASHSEAATEET